MPSQTVEKVVEQIKNLSKEEQIEVRNILNQISLTSEEIDRELQERLLKKGLITEIKPYHKPVVDESFKPIKVIGEPVSETIIRERR